MTEHSIQATRTERLILRRWRASDRAPFAELNADPRVMEFFPSTLSREESDAVADRIEAHWREHGFGLFALELPDVAPFIGFTGLMRPSFDAHFTPCVEVGWRLSAAFWGHGYAVEAARAALALGFSELGLTEIVSMTVPHNLRSRRVMEKLGMQHDEQGTFQHPRLPEDSPLRVHVLYRLKSAEFAR